MFLLIISKSRSVTIAVLIAVTGLYHIHNTNTEIFVIMTNVVTILRELMRVE